MSEKISLDSSVKSYTINFYDAPKECRERDKQEKRLNTLYIHIKEDSAKEPIVQDCQIDP